MCKDDICMDGVSGRMEFLVDKSDLLLLLRVEILFLVTFPRLIVLVNFFVFSPRRGPLAVVRSSLLGCLGFWF